MTDAMRTGAGKPGTGIVALAGNMEQDISIRVGPMASLPQLVESLGHDPQPIFRSLGFQLQQFQDPETRLPFLRTGELIARCAQVTGAAHLGLLMGQKATTSHLGLSGFVTQVAPTVEEALRVLVANLDLHDQGGVATLDTGPSHSSLGYHLIVPDVAGVEQVYDMAAVMLYNIMRTLCGEDWTADSVSLGRRLPADLAPYQKFFNTQLYFNAAESAVTFNSSWLQATPLRSDPLLYRHLLEEANQLHEAHRAELMDELPGYLHKALLSGQFSSKQVASQLGLHERTLHRRLKSAGTSFRHELDRARCALSKRLLGNTSLPVCDIAASLGYSDSSGFIRAFQRWCGTSPTAWRKQSGKQAEDTALNG